MVERSPLYAPLLNAEPLTSHTDDSQLSAGCRQAEPAREGFSIEGYPLTQLGSSPNSVMALHLSLLGYLYSHLLVRFLKF